MRWERHYLPLTGEKIEAQRSKSHTTKWHSLLLMLWIYLVPFYCLLWTGFRWWVASRDDLLVYRTLGRKLFDPPAVSLFISNPTHSGNTEYLQGPGTGCLKMPILSLGSEWYPEEMDTVQPKVRRRGTCHPRGMCRTSWLMGRDYSHCLGWGRWMGKASLRNWHLNWLWRWNSISSGWEGMDSSKDTWVSLAKPLLCARPWVKSFTVIISFLLPMTPWSVN